MSNEGCWNRLQIMTKPDRVMKGESFVRQTPLGVHLEVDEGVDGGVGHRQPEEGKEDMLSARVSSRVLVYIVLSAFDTFFDTHRGLRAPVSSLVVTTW